MPHRDPPSSATPFPTSDKGVQYRKLTRIEQIELCDRMKAGDLDARDELVNSVIPWIYHKCQQVTSKTTTPDEFQAVVLTVFESMKDFDARKGAITTWVNCRPKWVILRMRRQMSTIVKRPQTHKVRNPEADERASHMQSLNVLSMGQLDDALPQVGPPDYEGSSELAWLHREIEYLPERLAMVIRGRLAGETLKELGKKLRLTRERIRQLEEEAIQTLQWRMPLEEWEEMKKAA
jgi:RNA polymerase sigma factor (sigma-70 family)